MQPSRGVAIDAAAEAPTNQLDRFIELEAQSSGALRLTGGSGVCDVNCVVKRVTTLDGMWGSSPKDRGDARDEMLLSTLTVAVLGEKEK